MAAYHKNLISAVIALAFLVFMQTLNGVFRYLIPVAFLYSAIVLAYNYWYLKKNHFFSFWSWLRPLYLIAALVGLYFVLPPNFSRSFLVLFSVAALFFTERGIIVASEQGVFLETLFSYFGLSLGIFGLNNYLLPVNSSILIIFAITTFMVARSSFDYIPQPVDKKNFYAGLLGLSILEMVWALIFSPFHFTINAVIIFNIFYVLWIIIYYHLFQNLSVKKISFHVVFAGILIALSILSTPWHL